MAEREIRLFGDPVLKTPAATVTVFDDALKDLVRDLLDTTALPNRAGVAAPQIGVSQRVFAYHIEGRTGYVVNPEIVELSGEKREIGEGCLSVPELWFPTPRYERAVVRGVDADGEPLTLEGEGLMGQMLQHETDHLDGYVYLDRLEREHRKAALRQVRQSSWF